MADSLTPVPTLVPVMPWWVLPGLATIILIIYAGSLVAVCMLANDTLRTSMFGSVPVVVMAAINFFFGSSNGSQKKDDTIAAASGALATSVPVTPSTVTTKTTAP
jgi:hypothetical protein